MGPPIATIMGPGDIDPGAREPSSASFSLGTHNNLYATPLFLDTS
jgi:hypothetical protein